MKYYLSDKNKNRIGYAEDVKTALQLFGEQYDEDPAARATWVVDVYLNLSKDGASKDKWYASYYLYDFLNKSPEYYEGAAEYEKEFNQTIGQEEKPKLMTDEERKTFNTGNNRAIDEMAQGFTDEEMATIIKYVPTGFIIGELARRLQEYDNATNEIHHILSNMKIYQSDKKGM